MGNNKDDNQNQGQQDDNSPLLAQAQKALDKSGKESIVNKLKEILKRKQEAMKTVRLCDQEAQKLVEDFEAGIL